MVFTGERGGVHVGHQKASYFAIFFDPRIDLIANLIAMAARTCRAAQFRHTVTQHVFIEALA